MKFFFRTLYEYLTESRNQDAHMSVKDFHKFYQLSLETKDYRNGDTTS